MADPLVVSLVLNKLSLDVLRVSKDLASGSVALIDLVGHTNLVDGVVGETSRDDCKLSSYTHAHGADVVHRLATDSSVETISEDTKETTSS